MAAGEAVTPDELREKLGALWHDQILASVRGYDFVAKLYQDERERLAGSYLCALAQAHIDREFSVEVVRYR